MVWHEIRWSREKFESLFVKPTTQRNLYKTQGAECQGPAWLLLFEKLQRTLAATPTRNNHCGTALYETYTAILGGIWLCRQGALFEHIQYEHCFAYYNEKHAALTDYLYF